MRIPDLLSQRQPAISFELFPPKTEAAEQTLFLETIPALKRLGPAFVSVTFGAGGGTRDKTLQIVQRLRDDCGIESMAHLTCSGSTRSVLGDILDEADARGIDNILALRGDPPRSQPSFTPTTDGFSHAVELIRFIKSRGRFAIGAAGYPEGHLECSNKHLDWDRTAQKVEAGADFIITQLFYNVDDYLEFEDYLRNKRGIRVPIIPGVLPFLSAEQVKRFTVLCGAKLPQALSNQLEKWSQDDEAVRQLGVEVCGDICRRLLQNGVAGFHFYCLNRSASCSQLLTHLGLNQLDQ